MPANLDLTALRKLYEESTQGEWSFTWPDVTEQGHYETPKVFCVDDPDEPKYLAEIATGRNEEGDGLFIAAAHNSFRQLLDVAEQNVVLANTLEEIRQIASGEKELGDGCDEHDGIIEIDKIAADALAAYRKASEGK